MNRPIEHYHRRRSRSCCGCTSQ